MNRNTIIAQALSAISSELLKEQTDEQFISLIESHGLDKLVEPYLPYFADTQDYGHILLLGDTSIKPKDLDGCLKSLGISKNRLEHIEYDQVTNFSFRELEYSSNYRLILVGPIPHLAKGIGNSSNPITYLTNDPNIAKTIIFDDLKITKTKLKEVLQKEIDSGYLARG